MSSANPYQTNPVKSENYSDPNYRSERYGNVKTERGSYDDAAFSRYCLNFYGSAGKLQLTITTCRDRSAQCMEKVTYVHLVGWTWQFALVLVFGFASVWF